jgi:hypothetical protein
MVILGTRPIFAILAINLRKTAPSQPCCRAFLNKSKFSGLRSQSAQLPLRHTSRLRRHQIPQRVSRVIAAHPILIRIHFQDVLWPIRIVLHRRQGSSQAPAPLVDKHSRPHACRHIAEPLQYLWKGVRP